MQAKRSPEFWRSIKKKIIKKLYKMYFYSIKIQHIINIQSTAEKPEGFETEITVYILDNSYDLFPY